MPDFYTPEELDLYVKVQEIGVKAGLATEGEVQKAKDIGELGGFYKYERKRKRENILGLKRDLEAQFERNPHDLEAKRTADAIIPRLKEEGLLDESS